jgi:hypothetical protein
MQCAGCVAPFSVHFVPMEHQGNSAPISFADADFRRHTYPFFRRIWCSDHWRPPETVKMTSNECCDDVGWRAYPIIQKYGDSRFKKRAAKVET